MGPEASERDEHGLLRPDGPAALPRARVDPHVEQGGRLAPGELQGFVGVHCGLDPLFFFQVWTEITQKTKHTKIAQTTNKQTAIH